MLMQMTRFALWFWIVEIFLQYSTSGFAPLTITVRAINQARRSACQLSSPEYTCACYIDHSIEPLKSCLEGCVCAVCVEGIKVCVSVVFSYIEIVSRVYLPVYIFLLVSTISCSIRLNGLFVSYVISVTSERTHTHCAHALGRARTYTLATKADKTQTLTWRHTDIQSSDSR